MVNSEPEEPDDAARDQPDDPYAAPEKIISDHAGTVLDDEETMVPSLTISEERKATELFHFYDKEKTGLSGGEFQNAVKELEINLDEEQFVRYVHPFFERSGLDVAEDRLKLDGFLDLLSQVYAPGHKFGAHLRKAAGRGDDSIVHDLVSRGCNPLGADGGGFTALHYAAQYNRVQTIDLLVELCSSSIDEALNAQDNSGWTPLMVAAANGQVDAVNRLIERGARVDVHTNEGRTALHWAANKGKIGTMEIMIKHIQDPNVQDASGWTPLHCAALHGRVRACGLLVAGFKADIQIQDAIGNTPETYCNAETWQAILMEIERRKKHGDDKKKRK